VPLVLLIVAGISWLVGRSIEPFERGQQQAALQTALGIAVQPPVNFDATQFFRTAYHSDWTADIEKRIRIAAHQNQPNDHEGFYAKSIGVGAVVTATTLLGLHIQKSTSDAHGIETEGMGLYLSRIGDLLRSSC